MLKMVFTLLAVSVGASFSFALEVSEMLIGDNHVSCSELFWVHREHPRTPPKSEANIYGGLNATVRNVT